MLAFNFFLLPPFYTLTIADPQNWVALFVFVVVAFIASQLSAAVRQRASEAETRKQEVTRLFDLSRDILLTTDSDRAIADVARYVARRFELEAIAICLPTAAGWEVHQGGERSVEPARDQLDHAPCAAARPARVRRAAARVRRPSRGRRARKRHGDARSAAARHEARGHSGDRSPRRSISGTLDALGGVVAIAIERAHFLAERKKAESAESARRPGVGAPRLVQSRPPNAGDLGARGGDESAGRRAAAGGATRSGAAGACRSSIA